MLVLMMKNTGTACIAMPIQANVLMRMQFFESEYIYTAKIVPKAIKPPEFQGCKHLISPRFICMKWGGKNGQKRTH